MMLNNSSKSILPSNYEGVATAGASIRVDNVRGSITGSIEFQENIVEEPAPADKEIQHDDERYNSQE